MAVCQFIPSVCVCVCVWVWDFSVLKCSEMHELEQ